MRDGYYSNSLKMRSKLMVLGTKKIKNKNKIKIEFCHVSIVLASLEHILHFFFRIMQCFYMLFNSRYLPLEVFYKGGDCE